MAQKVCVHPIVQTIDEQNPPLKIRCCGCDAVWTLDTLPLTRLIEIVADCGGYDQFWALIFAGTRIVHETNLM